MTKYTDTERDEALKKVPEPISDFYGSQDLAKLINGIAVKNKLNIWQTGEVIQLIGDTLVGLRTVSSLENALHQALPELSNAVMREVVGDLNDRIFKEAQRRLKENVITPKPAWDEKTFGPREEAFKRISDREIREGAERERREGNAPSGLVEDTGPEGPYDENDVALAQSMVPVNQSLRKNSYQSVSSQKIESPVSIKPQEVTQSLPTEIPPEKPQTQTKPRDGVDPYREPIN